MPTAPSPTGPVTDVFTSQLGARGSAARSFSVASTGDISVTLKSIGPPADVTVGLGVGIPLANGAGCNLNRSIVTAASDSPQLTVTADRGSYCVRVYDVGNLTGEVSFSISLLHP